jgi:nicotinamide mononucleotide transporter
LIEQLLGQLAATSAWEWTAAGLGLAYLLLAVRRNLVCWLAAFLSVAIYLVIFAEAALYMHALLQVFYLAMAIYGFVYWRQGRTVSGDVRIRSWHGRQHAAAFAAIVIASLISGFLLTRHSDAAAPYLDSFVTWGSVVTTWMVARRLIENWLYWFVIDAAAVWLYAAQGLLVTALLFVIYLVIVVQGYISWRRALHEQRRAEAEPIAAGLIDGPR